MKADTFTKGDAVEFQDRHFVWRRGKVQCVDEKIHVLFHDSHARKSRVVLLPTKRVRRVK